MVTAWGHIVLFHCFFSFFFYLFLFLFSFLKQLFPKMTIKTAQFLNCSRAVHRCCACVHYSGRNADRLERRREEKRERELKTRGRRKFMSLLWDYTWQLRAHLVYIILLLCLLYLIVISTGPWSGSGTTCNWPLSGSTLKWNRPQHRFLRSTSKNHSMECQIIDLEQFQSNSRAVALIQTEL